MKLVKTTFFEDFEKYFIFQYMPGLPDMTYVKSRFDTGGWNEQSPSPPVSIPGKCIRNILHSSYHKQIVMSHTQKIMSQSYRLCSKILQIQQLANNRNLFFTILGSLGFRHQLGHVLVKILFHSQWLLAMSSPGASLQGSLWSLFYGFSNLMT